MFWKPAWRCARPFSSRTLRRQPTAQACSLVPPQMTGDICQHSTNLWLITVNSNNIAPPATLACSSAFHCPLRKYIIGMRCRPADASGCQKYLNLQASTNGTFCRVMTCAMEVLRFDVSSNVGVGGACDAASLTAAAVRKRFLELSVAVHPDKNSHPQAEQVACCCP